jgi:deoxyribodipyrimidine photo-lyase
MGDATRGAGLRRLHDFVHRAGPLYAKSRNFDFGPQRRGNVSLLSPYLRHRLVLEQEVLETVVQQHRDGGSRKFVEEVLWRAYFKGWLEQHPSVWTDYRRAVAQLLQTLEDDSDALHRYETAVGANTGIDCFDAWVDELRTHGYLHNHARMWFASIWVFTLGLPWQLGADFFYRHLVDGDPASNTLGWRWVSGLHTAGKTYLARASNISHFSENRFSPEGKLATSAPALTEAATHATSPLPAANALPAAKRFGLLITEEDCNPESLPLDETPIAVLGALATHLRSPLPVGEHAAGFVEGAVKDAIGRASREFAVDGSMTNSDDWSAALLDWSSKYQFKTIVTAYAPVGPVAELLADARETLASNGVSLLQLRRPYDTATWPHAQRSFFRFRKQVLAELDGLGVGSGREIDRKKAG